MTDINAVAAAAAADVITEPPGEDAEPEDRRKAPNDHRFPAEGDELPTPDGVEDD